MPTKRGFAAMDPERQKQIAAKGGRSVDPANRSFSKDAKLAATAGRKGGQNIPGQDRSFAVDRELASRAGRKGGQNSHAPKAKTR